MSYVDRTFRPTSLLLFVIALSAAVSHGPIRAATPVPVTPLPALAQTGMFFGSATDPVGDADTADLVEGSVLIANGEVQIAIRFAPGTYDPRVTPLMIGFDTDQDVTTGHSGVGFDETLDVSAIGSEFVVLLHQSFGVEETTVLLLKHLGFFNQFQVLGSHPARFVQDGVDIIVPFAPFEDDGLVDFKVATGVVFDDETSVVDDVMPDIGLAAASTAPLPPPTMGLADEVNDLVTDGVITAGQADGLLAKLAAVEDSLARGNSTAACNQLRAFTNQVAAFIRNGSLTLEEGQLLLAEADSLRDLIGC